MLRESNVIAGAVYRATDILLKKDVALKLEPAEDLSSQLENEVMVYESLGGLTGFPRMLWFGQDKGFNAMAMEMLGPSLAHLLDDCDGKFSITTVAMIGEQVVRIFIFFTTTRCS